MDAPFLDFEEIDRAGVMLLGKSPSEMDELSLYELYIMLDSAAERHRMEQREAWQRSLAVATAILNWGGMRGKGFQEKPLSFLADALLDGGRSAGRMTHEQYAEERRAAEERRSARKKRRISQMRRVV